MTSPVPENEVARVPGRTVMLSIVLLWLCYFLITTVRGSIIGLDFDSETLLRRAMVCAAGIIVTTVLWLVIRLVDRHAVWVKALVSPLVAIPAALAIAQANQWAFADIQSKAIQKIGAEQGIKLRQDEAGNILLDLPEAAPTGTMQAGAGGTIEAADSGGRSGTITLAKAPAGLDRWRQLSGVALSPYFLLLAWAALYLALLAGAQARAAERREERFRSAAKAAELRSLRYQVNPHFLFNTLNSLSSMVMTGKTEQAEAMIQTIASFYRHSLADDASADVMLADEFALQQHYLDIEAVRFPDRLCPVFELAEGLGEARVPGMILQPLVENSVKYGVAPVNRPVTLKVTAREEFGRLVLEVRDDGPGVPHGASNGFGIGLANVRDRLEARFGKEASLVSGPVGNGYRTEIRIPLVTHG